MKSVAMRPESYERPADVLVADLGLEDKRDVLAQWRAKALRELASDEEGMQPPPGSSPGEELRQLECAQHLVELAIVGRDRGGRS